MGRLGPAKGTVRRFARATTVDELLTNGGTGHRPSLLEEFKPYLHQRWTAGCANATLLFDEIKASDDWTRSWFEARNLPPMAGHVRSFATMMCTLRGDRLEAWMTAVDADDLPALSSFVIGLRRDQDAVTAGPTLHWNSGPVEGHVNRIKMLKRQMYGRANPDLLRKRILLAH